MTLQHWLETATEDDDDLDALYELAVEQALEQRHLDQWAVDQ